MINQTFPYFKFVRIGLVVASLAVLAAAFMIRTTPLASASYGTGPCVKSLVGTNQVFDGEVNTNISNITGVTAKIGTDNPGICADSSRGSSSVWVMLLNNSGCYAQAGWAKDYPATAPSFFVEMTDSNCLPLATVWFGNPQIGSQHTYKVTYDSSSTFHLYIDGTLMYTKQENWRPNGDQFSGEAHDTADQMPGGYNSYIYFSSAQYRQGSTWYGGNQSSYNHFPYGGLWFPGGQSLGIYDTRYAS